MSTKRMNGNYFVMGNGQYCGLIMPEHVMKKLSKIFARHNDEIKDFLTKHKEELYAESWTLAYPNGKQEGVYYNDAFATVEERIDNYDENLKIRRLSDFYLSDTENPQKRAEEAATLFMDKYDESREVETSQDKEAEDLELD